MTLIVELPQDLERALSAEAAALGLPLLEYALRLLYSRQVVGQKPETGSELVAYWQNAHLIGMRQDVGDSQAYARQLRAQAEMRVRE